jgi:hypothetical protein
MNASIAFCRHALRSGGLLFVVSVIFACQTTYPPRNPTGEAFPSITGTSLEGREIALPESLAGEPVLLLIGFEQETQFDLDRWALGLWQSGATLRVLEIPTIPGLVPRLLSDRIDRGMRSGIPDEDWGSVVTVYRDADTLARFTGNENPLPGRVLLLDEAGRVVFFHDEGYSTGALVRLLEAADRL